MQKRILSPLNDFVFRLLFGDQRNIKLLTAFLKASLDLPSEEYDRLIIIDPHLKKEKKEGKSGVLDVKVHTRSGIIINVEIQVSSSKELRKRFAWYGAKMLAGQISRGDQYRKLERVVSIIIVAEELVEEDRGYYNKYVIMNGKTGTVFTDLLEINVLELSKLPAESDGTALWNWGQFLKCESEEEFDMIAEKDPDVRETVVTLKELSDDERNQMLADARMMKEWDEWGFRKEHYERGYRRAREEATRKMKKMGLSSEQIMYATGLSSEEIGKVY
ncbi:hypothetical protein AGMMS49587_19140 [Spirochaetia bacterium]|nr:hypothetical protein AGMMS49587_19140 [Spirochaetia bacterium]